VIHHIQKGNRGAEMSKPGTFIPIAGVVAVGIGATWTWEWTVASLFPAEEVTGVAVVGGENGKPGYLFVTESVAHDHWLDPQIESSYTTRVAVYDLATGVRTSRRVISRTVPKYHSLSPLGPGPGGFWFFNSATGIELLSPDDGTVIRSATELLSPAQLGKLPKSGAIETRVAYLPTERAPILTLNDGTRIRLSANATQGEPFRGTVPKYQPRLAPANTTTLPLEGKRSLRLEHQESDPLRSARLQAPSGSGTTPFLNPFFLTTDTAAPILLADPDSTLVVHTEHVGTGSAKILSRVRFDDGSALWSTPLGKSARISLATATAERLILVASLDDKTVLLALGRGDGAELYRVALD